MKHRRNVEAKVQLYSHSAVGQAADRVAAELSLERFFYGYARS